MTVTLKYANPLTLVALLICAGCQQEPEPTGESRPPRGAAEQPQANNPGPGKVSAAEGKLPNGWQLTAAVHVDAQKAAQIGKRLGGQVQQLNNIIYSVEGQDLQLNMIRCGNVESAKRIAASLLKIHGGIHCRCLRDEQIVYEFVCQDLRLVERAYRDLKMTASTVTYEVMFQAAPLEKADSMQWNRLFNACLAKDESGVQELLPSFTFSNMLSVRKFGQGAVKSSYTFEPKARETTQRAAGELSGHRFVDLPTSLGIPQVTIQVQVSSAGFAVTKASRKDKELVAATPYWPSEDSQVVQLSQQIVAGKTSARERLQELLNWFADRRNMRFDGAVVGSRYGVEKVIEQRFGHCWDYSDLFVTLARAAGIPCRQVYGWLYGQSGHVWVEVLTDEGWRAVDPTAGMGCDSRYIPLFTTEDGAVDFVYTSMPQIKIVAGP